MATSHEQMEKEGQIRNLWSSAYHMVKIGQVDHEIICLQGFIA